MNNIQVNVTDREFPTAKKFSDLEVGEFFTLVNSNVRNVFLKIAETTKTLNCMSITNKSTWYGFLSCEAHSTFVIPVKSVKIDITL